MKKMLPLIFVLLFSFNRDYSQTTPKSTLQQAIADQTSIPARDDIGGCLIRGKAVTRYESQNQSTEVVGGTYTSEGEVTTVVTRQKKEVQVPVYEDSWINKCSHRVVLRGIKKFSDDDGSVFYQDISIYMNPDESTPYVQILAKFPKETAPVNNAYYFDYKSSPKTNTLEALKNITPFNDVATPLTKSIYKQALEKYRLEDYAGAYNLLMKIPLYAAAQDLIGDYYYTGLAGISQNKNESFKWYMKAALKGHARSEFDVGFSYDFGLGVLKDIPTAIAWYEKASAQGEGNAMFHLGEFYYYGEGYNKDLEKAIYFYSKAAAKGIGSAEYKLGTLYEDGIGVKKNFHMALSWYIKSAINEDPDAQYKIGDCLTNGKNVYRNMDEGLLYISLALENGSDDAKTWYQSYIGTTKSINVGKPPIAINENTNFGEIKVGQLIDKLPPNFLKISINDRTFYKSPDNLICKPIILDGQLVYKVLFNESKIKTYY